MQLFHASLYIHTCIYHIHWLKACNLSAISLHSLYSLHSPANHAPNAHTSPNSNNLTFRGILHPFHQIITSVFKAQIVRRYTFPGNIVHFFLLEKTAQIHLSHV
ncbi:hypothetical protein XENTR_v10018365 [Xenopus tropicalis]|nr:hypothetical protein XENTR_v10018365 [Xenopus tropicalis]